MMQDKRALQRTNVWAWMAFDWAAQPYFTLIATFVFPPFFVTFLVGDAVEGQRLWGWTMAVAAALVGVMAPFVGRYADASNRVNSVFSIACCLAIASSAALWFCDPQWQYGLALAIGLSVLSSIGFEVATSLNNAMVLRYVPRSEASRVAWIGWTCGSASGILVLLIFIFLSSGFVSVLPSEFSLIARISGPFTAFWFALFLIPLFLTFRARTAQVQSKDAVLTESPPYSPRLLLAVMIYSNALLALFAFGGIYAAVIFNWQGTKLLLLSLLLTVAGFTGVLAAIPLERALGTVRIALMASAAILCAGAGILTLDPNWLFLWPSTPLSFWPDVTSSELCFLLLAYVIGAASASLESSLRVIFLAHVPAEKAGLSFGLFAFSGKSTAFIGPLLVSLTIGAFHSTKAGMIVIFVLIACATALLRSEKKSAVPTAH